MIPPADKRPRDDERAGAAVSEGTLLPCAPVPAAERPLELGADSTAIPGLRPRKETGAAFMPLEFTEVLKCIDDLRLVIDATLC